MLEAIRFAALAKGCSGGRHGSSGGDEPVQLGQDGSDLDGARVLVPVIRSRLPERDHIPAHVDRLFKVHDADRRIIHGLQPPGDRHRAAGMLNIGPRTRDPGDDGGLEAVDRVGAQAQLPRAGGV